MDECNNLTVLVLLSGGLDSALTSAYLQDQGYRVYGFFVNREQKNLERERQGAKRTSDVLRLDGLFEATLSLTNIRKFLSPEVLRSKGIPGRNLALISLAMPYADLLGCDVVATGNIVSDNFPDCNQQFRESFSRTATLALDRSISVVSPFADWEKWDKSNEIRWGYQKGYEELIESTWTCWNAGEKHCGKCPACVDRREGFDKAGISDPTQYLDTLVNAI